MHVTSNGWDYERMFARNQVLEVRCDNGTLHVARKERHHDEWDVPTEPYDPTDRASKRSMRKPQMTRHSDDVTARWRVT
jgi:hypothetical protein